MVDIFTILQRQVSRSELLSEEGAEQDGPMSWFLPVIAAILGLPSNSKLEGVAVQQLHEKGWVNLEGVCLNSKEMLGKFGGGLLE
jgi:hypothetical protein